MEEAVTTTKEDAKGTNMIAAASRKTVAGNPEAEEINVFQFSAQGQTVQKRRNPQFQRKEHSWWKKGQAKKKRELLCKSKV